jgi:hypothetical protein
LGKKRRAKSLLAGFAGGVAGAWAMRRFSAIWRKLGGPSCAPPGQPYSSQEWDSAGGVAEGMAKLLLRRSLCLKEKLQGAAAVHYAVGGAAAAAYAIVRESCPRVRASSGVAFGIAFWLLGDELVMPRVGLTARPSDYALLAHVNSLGEHLVYGLTAEQVRRSVLRMW